MTDDILAPAPPDRPVFVGVTVDTTDPDRPRRGVPVTVQRVPDPPTPRH